MPRLSLRTLLRSLASLEGRQVGNSKRSRLIRHRSQLRWVHDRLSSEGGLGVCRSGICAAEVRRRVAPRGCCCRRRRADRSRKTHKVLCEEEIAMTLRKRIQDPQPRIGTAKRAPSSWLPLFGPAAQAVSLFTGDGSYLRDPVRVLKKNTSSPQMAAPFEKKASKSQKHRIHGRPQPLLTPSEIETMISRWWYAAQPARPWRSSNFRMQTSRTAPPVSIRTSFRIENSIAAPSLPGSELTLGCRSIDEPANNRNPVSPARARPADRRKS
jgi:hypothetical protein